jgi:hypothetical protein
MRVLHFCNTKIQLYGLKTTRKIILKEKLKHLYNLYYKSVKTKFL